MTYNVFGGMLDLAQWYMMDGQTDRWTPDDS